MTMKAVLSSLCAALTASAVQAQDPQDLAALQLKPGLWETQTLVFKMEEDGKDMVAQTKANIKQRLARLTPEQRQKLEAEQQQNKKQYGLDPEGRRVCMGPESGKSYVSQNFLPFLTMPGCTQSRSRDGNRTIYEASCQGKGGTTKHKLVAADGLLVIRTEGNFPATADQPLRTMLSESQMKFIGSDCGDLKSMEQKMEEARQALIKREQARKARP
jgi:hypothetical protein